MFYPSGNFSQGIPQSNFYPQGPAYLPASFGPQAFQGNPFSLQGNPFQSNIGSQGNSVGSQGNFGNVPFLSTPYGYPQHAAQQLLAHQLATQHLLAQQPAGLNAFNGLSNGAAQAPGAWTQQQVNPEQINPAIAARHHLLQQLSQYHYLIAQQLAQMAAQQAVQSSSVSNAAPFIPGAGQFTPGPYGANFVPGFTMH
jgi:hypothetical protein